MSLDFFQILISKRSCKVQTYRFIKYVCKFHYIYTVLVRELKIRLSNGTVRKHILFTKSTNDFCTPPTLCLSDNPSEPLVRLADCIFLDLLLLRLFTLRVVHTCVIEVAGPNKQAFC